jgi:phosphotransferase system enzyme I (PtsI)
MKQSMQVLQGIAVSPGVAIGEALVMGHEGFRIPRRFVARDAVEDELDRLDRAIAAAGDEIQRNRDAVSGELGEQYAAIFDAHLRMLRDARLRSEIETLITQRHYSPEYAVSRSLRRYAKVFQSLETSYLAERVHDIYDIEKRLLRHLLGRRREEISHLTSPVVILAHNLTPSETANLDRTFVQGFVTEIGGPGSHTAIVAAGMEIPAVVGTGPFLTDVSGGDLVIIDGDHGQVILQPDEEAIARYRHEAEEHRTLAARLETLRDLPADTADGTHVDIYGNIEFPYEVKSCVERGSGGVGLYRTEFLYLGRETPPTEEDHYEAYAEVIRAMGELPVVIRTLDLGVDKLDEPSANTEANPCLGLRSIRLSLRDVPLFRTQLRAILRASVLGNVRMMFPMITTLLELRQARMILADVMEDLDDAGTPFDHDIPVGMMVEVPSAALLLDLFVKEVDFVSIGTNDLVQYTLAADRANKDVASLYNAADPAVLRLLRSAIRDAMRGQVPVGMCGQMSGQTKFTMLLLGLGLRQFSVTPTNIPEIKKVCRSVTIEQCERLSDKVMNMENARDIESFLKEELKKTVPELAV